MARAGNIQSISALRDAARRKLPRFAFDFIDGGALEEVALKNNRLAFDSVRIRPRILSGNLSRTTHCNILGSRFNGPFVAVHIRRSQSFLNFDEMKAWSPAPPRRHT